MMRITFFGSRISLSVRAVEKMKSRLPSGARLAQAAIFHMTMSTAPMNPSCLIIPGIQIKLLSSTSYWAQTLSLMPIKAERSPADQNRFWSRSTHSAGKCLGCRTLKICFGGMLQMTVSHSMVSNSPSLFRIITPRALPSSTMISSTGVARMISPPAAFKACSMANGMAMHPGSATVATDPECRFI